MNSPLTIVVILLGSCVAGVQVPSVATAQEPTASDTPTLEELKTAGALRSSYRKPITPAKTDETPQANLKLFRAEIEPTLKKVCYECHGSETAEGDFRVDTLDPDLLHGNDVKKWLEVSAAVTNGEMPPEEGPELADDDRSKIVEWLSSEIQVASRVRRAGHQRRSRRLLGQSVQGWRNSKRMEKDRKDQNLPL